MSSDNQEKALLTAMEAHRLQLEQLISDNYFIGSFGGDNLAAKPPPVVLTPFRGQVTNSPIQAAFAQLSVDAEKRLADDLQSIAKTLGIPVENIIVERG